jgi:hypothetical protein
MNAFSFFYGLNQHEINTTVSQFFIACSIQVAAAWYAGILPE